MSAAKHGFSAEDLVNSSESEEVLLQCSPPLPFPPPAPPRKLTRRCSHFIYGMLVTILQHQVLRVGHGDQIASLLN